MKKFLYIVIMLISLCIFSTTTFGEEINNLNSSTQKGIDSMLDEPLDSWMPDPSVQLQISQQLNVPIESITKELLSNYDEVININVDLGTSESYFAKNITGLEYAKIYSVWLVPSSFTTTESLNDLFENRLQNLVGFNWYGGMANYSQIDLYSIFKDAPYFWKEEGTTPNGFFTINGAIMMPSKTPLIIPEESYKTGGKLAISLHDIGIWSSTDKKLITTLTHQNVTDLIIKNNGDIIATYKFDYFDVTTQSFIFSFDANNSESFDHLAGKVLYYPLPSVEEVGYYPDLTNIPVFDFNLMNNYLEGHTNFSQFNGKFIFDNIKFMKNPVVGKNVTAKYQDTNGKQIHDDVVKSGNIGDSYNTEQLSITGHTFKEVQGSPSGTFIDQEQTVTYIYTKDPVAGKNVTAKYQDTNGKQIHDDVVKSGNIGDSYTTDQLKIDGYTFKEVKGNPSGTFIDQEQTVTYIYTNNAKNSATIDGSDYTMYLGDPKPTVKDFKATAKDKDGNSIDVTVNLDAIDFSKPGTHQVTLKATDGQTKQVTLYIKEKIKEESDTPKATEPSTSSENQLKGSEKSVIPRITSENQLPTTTDRSENNTNNITTPTDTGTTKQYPATGEKQNHSWLIAGILLIIAILGYYFWDRNKKKTD